MIIELGIAASIGAIVGFGTCAVLTAGKVADIDSLRLELERVNKVKDHRTEQGLDLLTAHTRCADSRNVLLSRMESIRELLNRPGTIRKGELAAILDGDAL